ncbi:MAG TPA: FprA family A-type flavoprotein [Candidatus Coproplasma avicola]|uniref:FprA family A-type flavoprotein n=1 Tax=Candidatus Coproplasma avicola TaxID=2840744 RepID=A0A9D1E783_9FIRM|nr:FprA family A-type flavoprotein [Candidatus Coproplasma avicola]
MKLSAKDTYYVGVNDHQSDLFEGIYKIPNGVAYNSYVIVDDKIAVMDAVDEIFGDEWMANVKEVLGGRKPDYIVIQHMEPDHSANALRFAREYPDVKLVGNTKTFVMLEEYFGTDFADRRVVVGDGDAISLGRHELRFMFAPMVHWPEVMVTYDAFTKTVFSADGFGKFGALDVEEPWDDEARRYYIGIVGKYGKQVDAALKKLSALQIERICPLHGPVLEGDLSHYFGLYSTWANYEPEIDGVMIAYASVYGHTKKAAELLAEELKAAGCKNVLMHDLARDDRSVCVADAFRYSRLVIAGITYNASLFPAVREFIENLTERNYQKRVVGFIENGTWAPVAARLMQEKFGKSNITFAQNTVSVRAALNNQTCEQVKALAVEMAK